MTKCRKITKSCIASLLFVVYNTIIWDTKTNKYHINFLAAHVESSTGVDNSIAHFSSVSDAVDNNKNIMIRYKTLIWLMLIKIPIWELWIEIPIWEPVAILIWVQHTRSSRRRRGGGIFYNKASRGIFLLDVGLTNILQAIILFPRPPIS